MSKPTFTAHIWEARDEYIVCVDGAPTGGTVNERDAKVIARWLTGAWSEMLKNAKVPA